MTKYTISVAIQDIEAENEVEAYAKANDLLLKGSYSLDIVDEEDCSECLKTSEQRQVKA